MINLKKYLPHLIAVAVFLAITFAYFSPMLSGKVLRQSDIMNWQGMAKEIGDFRDKYHSEPLWTNSMFGGMPAYQIAVEYHGNTLIKVLDNIATLGLPEPAATVFLYLIGFYFLLITLKVDQRVAILGAIAFTFSSFLFIIIGVGHTSQARAVSYMAPVIAGLLMTYRGRLQLGLAVTGIALVLELYANHLQITYYLLLTVAMLFIVELYNSFREKRISQFVKANVFLAGIALLAVGANIAILLETAEYGKYSTRGPSELTVNQENKTSGLDRDYITQWSYGVGESFTFLVPDFKGGPSEPIGRNHKEVLKDVDERFRQNIAQFSAYYGDQPFTAGPTYLGAIVCLLFIIGLFIVKGDLKWWIVTASLLMLMLSWGKNFMGLTNFFLDHVPGYDKFRTVAMILVIVEFLVPLMAALALDRLLKNSDFIEKNKKRIYYGLGIGVGLSLLILIAPSMFTSFYTQTEYDQVLSSVKGQNIPQDVIDGFFSAVETARKAIFNADAMRTFFFVLIAAGLLGAYVRFKFKKEYLIYTLIVLVLFDMWGIDKRYLNSDDFIRKTVAATPFPMTKADEIIKQDPSQSYRVFNVSVDAFQDASTSYYHQSIGGYHGAKLKRYKELIDNCLTQEEQTVRAAFQGANDSATIQTLAAQPGLNMLNAKYIIYNAEAPPLINRSALGNAWFVREYKMVPNADSELAAINTLQPAKTAVIDVRFKNQMEGFTPAPDSSASISLTSYLPNDLVYQSKSSTEQLAVFSEIYYDKGWNAYIDGKLTPYVRANYVLRAMRIPQGAHNIEWKFEPAVHAKGEKIAFRQFDPPGSSFRRFNL